MPLSTKAMTTLTLLIGRQAAADDLSWAMTEALVGDGSAGEKNALRKIAALDSETTLLETRIRAIANGGSFTAPSAEEKGALMAAIAATRVAIQGSAALTALLAAATGLLNTFGAAEAA